MAAFVLFAAMVGMVVFSSEQSDLDNQKQPSIAEQSNADDKGSAAYKSTHDRIDERKKKREWYYTFIDRPTDWLLVLFNGLLVAATIALFISGERNVDAARRSAAAANRSAEIAERALIVTQRPYVRVATFPWLWRRETDEKVAKERGPIWYDMTPIVENVGGTPTVDMMINVNYELRDTVLPPDFDFPFKGEAGPTFVGAHQSIGASRAIIYDRDLVAVQNGTKFFYIWGTITYRDGFANTPIHTTEFCTFISKVFGDPVDPSDPVNPKGTTVEISFGIYPKHQKAD